MENEWRDLTDEIRRPKVYLIYEIVWFNGELDGKERRKKTVLEVISQNSRSACGHHTASRMEPKRLAVGYG